MKVNIIKLSQLDTFFQLRKVSDEVREHTRIISDLRAQRDKKIAKLHDALSRYEALQKEHTG